MRITNGMMINNMLWGLNNNLTKLEKAQKQITSGTQIQVASDDPVLAARVLRMRSYVNETAQLQKNADDAVSWMEFCDSALDGLGDAVEDIKVLVIQAANDTYNEEDLQSIKSQIIEIKKGIMDLGNSSFSGRYVFAGFDTDEAPFVAENTAIGDMIMYRGKYLSLGGIVPASVSDEDYISFYLSNKDNCVTGSVKEEIEYKIGASNKVCINAEGNEIFGQEGSSIFDSIKKLELALSGETSYKTAVYSEGPPEEVTIETHELDISSVLSDLEEDTGRLLKARTDLGARTSYVKLTQNCLSNNYTIFTELLSKNEDADYAETAIKLSTAETIYNASLSAGSKVILHSLLDFLG
ncbi:MAG TPA: flagellar hook-associated protein FlgL [Clostridia bacterium]|nr:flagellar hook-associated protein FlgL [Clostridia bacterium]